MFLRAELPGVDPSDLNVSVVGNTLTISGEKKDERETDDASVYFREASYGKFERSFRFPESVKSDQLKACFENGVLELSMPSPAHAEPRKVQIEVTASESP